MNSYQIIFKELSAAEIKYIVVGGVAMNLLGYPRFTGDIDILLALDSENLQKTSDLMKMMGYERRVPVALEELGDEKKALTFLQEKNLIAYSFAHSTEPQLGIDVIVGESLHFQEYADRSSVLRVWGIDIPVVSIDDLIGMKRSSNRKKDIEDVAALLELKGL